MCAALCSRASGLQGDRGPLPILDVLDHAGRDPGDVLDGEHDLQIINPADSEAAIRERLAEATSLLVF
jgi:hypothetical protein